MNKIKLIKSSISNEIGWLWPFFIIKCFLKKKSAFNKTNWASKENDEAKLMESLSLGVVIYKELKKKTNQEKALNMMRNIIIPFAFNQVDELLQPLRIAHKEPMQVLLGYLRRVDNEGVGKFCEREQENDENSCHRAVKKCPFHDFHIETGVPELTQIFCETDIVFYTKCFPEFNFHRNGSWENTIGYGKNECEFVFEIK